MRSVVAWNVIMRHVTAYFMKEGCPWHSIHTILASAGAYETYYNSEVYNADKDSTAKSIRTSVVV